MTDGEKALRIALNSTGNDDKNYFLANIEYAIFR